MAEKKLSFNLKNEGAGITGTVDVQSPLEPQGQTPVSDDNKAYYWGIIILGGILSIGLIVARCLDKVSTGHALLGCASILAVFTLFFGIHCWYRICMARSIVDEQKMNYGVLKELVGKLPERSETNMLIGDVRDLLKEISGKLVRLDQTCDSMVNSCGFLQQIKQTLQTKK